MIQAKNLRIGNWVRVNSPGNAAHGHSGKVTEVDHEHVHLDFVKFCELAALEGIRISPEILEKVGFIVERFPGEDDVLIYHGRGKAMFGSFNEKAGKLSIDKIHPRKLQAVHELQNYYFAVYGEELVFSLE